MAKRKTMPARLLIVDNDARYGEWLRHHLGVLYPDATVSVLGLTEFSRWSGMLTGRDCDILLISASFGSSPEDPQARGLELLRELRGLPVFPAVIAIAEEGNELTAVRALQLGAVDYLPKSLLTPERLKTSVRLALRRLEKRVARRIASLAQIADPQPPVAGQRPPAPAASEAPPSPTAANFIPGYTIRTTIGESEKAVVYLAMSASLGHHVALKVSKTLRDETAGRQFLEREYTAIVAIRNPAVVRIYDYDVHAGYEYIAMEYLPRGDLKARMQQGMTEQDALRYVEQIAAALRVVHHAGLLHRDLKPPNVMLRENGDVALIDFGLARALDGSSQSTRTGVLRGSPYYMSPEQALGEQLDARSDFYSLGIMFYEMLTGRKAYTGGSAMEVLQQHVNAPLPRLPPSLAHCERPLRKLLAKARDERYAKAEDIIDAIITARGTMDVAAETHSTAA
jgi:DNA-binding NarL/FixJ family response regulator/predicted Ser/Thr protein kinase